MPFFCCLKDQHIKKKGIFAIQIKIRGSSSVGRALASQAKSREFESRLPLT